MRLRVLGCYGGSVKGSHLTCFLLNDAIALDAGSLTQTLSLREQLAVRHIVVSHSHLDHNGALPYFAINVYGRIDEPVAVYATAEVLDALRRHMFNDVLWPDFSRLPSAGAPTLRFEEIRPERPFEIDGLRLTPVAVDHVTPTVGFLIEDGGGAVLYTSDTGPTERVWELARATSRLRAVITEASFPDEEEELAKASGHMTPSMLARELEKLDPTVRVLVSHVKPGHRGRIARQLRALGRSRLELLRQGRTYRF